jgi:hypothetical protein
VALAACLALTACVASVAAAETAADSGLLPAAIEGGSFVETKLKASDNAPFYEFGFSVAVSEDTAVIGAPGALFGSTTAGAAYVLTRRGSTWDLQQKLTAGDAESGDTFGWSVAVSGNIIVIGRPFDSEAGFASGSAYVFAREGGVWSQWQKLVPSDLENGDEFGISVSISRDTAVIGTIVGDTAYVFVRSENLWIQQQKLAASGAFTFGAAVAVSGDTAVIGAFEEGGSTGAAYVFVRNHGVWSQQQKLKPSEFLGASDFGYSVAIKGDTVLVGAPLDLHAGFASGSAFVFVRRRGVWSEQQRLTASDAALGDEFGFFVAVSGDAAVIGAPGGYRAHATGSAYVFSRSGDSWAQQGKLIASDAAEGDLFGGAVAVSGHTIVIGTPGDDQGGTNSGAAYVYAPGPH